MKIKEGKSITLLLVMMLILMNLFAVPAWAAPGDVEINDTNFPDANFRSYVSTNFDKDSNGVLSQGELDAVNTIYVFTKDITTLKGVEHFANLSELFCQETQLTALDVTKNPELAKLYCSYNQLTALDVTKNPKLEELWCGENQLTALDVTKNPELTSLDCRNNQLTALDVTKNPKLDKLYCISNQLTALDVTKNPKLDKLWCYENQLTALDVTKNPKLKDLDCHFNQLTALDVTKNQELTSLNCIKNQLTALDVTKNLELTVLGCESNQLTALDVTKNPKLDILGCDENQLTALDVTKNPELYYFTCYDNQLTALDVTKNPKLEELDCYSNQLTALDVTKNPKLHTLVCYENQLTALDVTKNPELVYLYCRNNQLRALDVTKNPKLNSLSCVSNQLTALDVTKNPGLFGLWCDENQLTALDVTKNLELGVLWCDENQLTALDITKNPELDYLKCGGNQLTSLDLTANTKITKFIGSDQEYNVEVGKSDLTFDLSSLPGNFDPSKASGWRGATVSGNTLTLDSTKPSTVTYTYEARPGKNLSVTLNVSYKEEFKISFDKNGGSGTIADVKVDKGSNYSLPACKFTAPAGKEFKAWEVGGVEKAVGDNITVNADTKVKALWKDKAVTPGTNPSDNPMTKELDVMTEGQNDINTFAKGNQLIYVVGKSTKAVFRILGEDLGVEDLKSVLLDGKLVDASNYDVSKGSIIVSFKKSYGDSLSPGTHEITFKTTKGVAKAELVVKQKTQTSTNITKTSKSQPNTGDNTMLYVYTLGLLMAASGMLILNARRNKKEQ